MTAGRNTKRIKSAAEIPKSPQKNCAENNKYANRAGVVPCPVLFIRKLNGMIATLRQVCRGRIVASRAVYPLYRIIGTTAAGGIYAAPTNRPTMFTLPFCRGRGVPRPYRAMIFIAL